MITRRQALSVITAPLLSRRSFGQTLQAPPQAAAWGYNRLAFFDDFTSLSTVDLTNSRSGAFNWFINNSFPSAIVKNSPWKNIATAPPTPVSAISQAGSILTLLDDVSHIGEGLNTCVWTGSSAIGTTFANGFYVECRMSFDPSLAVSPSWNSWPIYWLAPVELLNGAISAQDFVEIDGFEAYPDKVGVIKPSMTIHDWLLNSGSGSHNNANTNNDIDTFVSGIPGFQWTDMHALGTLWVPMNLNNGVGLFRRYVDGAFVNKTHFGPSSEIQYTLGGAATPGVRPNNPAGTFSSIENWNYCLMLGAGHNWPASFDYVAVWQS